MKKYIVYVLLKLSLLLWVSISPTVHADVQTNIIELPETVVIAKKPTVMESTAGNRAISIDVENKKFTSDRVEQLLEQYTNTDIHIKDGGISTGVNSRGFDVNQFYVDGLPDINRMFVRDMSSLERVDYTAGINSISHSTSAATGYVNQTTKKPKHDSTLSYTNARLKHFDSLLNQPQRDDRLLSQRMSYDINRPLTDSLALRLSGAFQDGKNAVVLPQEKSQNMASVSWNLPSRDDVSQNLLLQYEHSKTHIPFDFGSIIFGSGTANERIMFDKNYTDINVPVNRKATRTHVQHSYINSRLATKLQYAKSHIARQEELNGFWTIQNTGVLSGYYTGIQDNYTQEDAKASLTLFSPFSLSDDFTYQVDFSAEQNRQNTDFFGDQNIAGFEIDIAQPVINESLHAGLDKRVRYQKKRYKNTSYSGALTLSDKAELFFLKTGLRRTHFDIANTRNQNIDPVTLAKQSHTSYQINGVYHFNDILKIYGNVANTYTPNIGLTKSGDFLNSKKVEQHEAGFVFDTGTMHSTIGYYDINQDNLTERDPEDRSYLRNAGSASSRGFYIAKELTFSHGLALHLHANKQRTKDRYDRPFVGVAKNKVRLSIEKAGITLAPKVEAKLSAAVQYIGKRPAGYTENTVNLYAPRYSKLNLSASATKKLNKKSSVSAFLGVNNILKKSYIADISSADTLSIGQPRTVTLSISVNH